MRKGEGRSNKYKYNPENVYGHKNWEAVLYFIKRGEEHGRSIETFSIKSWLNEHGQIANFWKMEKESTSFRYWRSVIDHMFENKHFRRREQLLLSDLLYAANQHGPDKKDAIPDTIKDQDIIAECEERIGVWDHKGRKSRGNSRYDKYFQKDGLPKPFVLYYFELNNNAEFNQSVLERINHPYWLNERTTNGTRV